MRFRPAFSCLLAILVCTAFAAIAPAIEHSFVESFDTKLYCDHVTTTAAWDTVAGVLKMGPFTMQLTGSYNTAGNARGVTVDGKYAYVADHSAGLQIVDISDLANPTLAATYNTAGNAKSVWVDGNYAYVADYADGLIVLDITDPTSPSLAGSCDTPGSARDVVVDGNYAYVADYSSGLQVINITYPAGPVIAGGYDTAGNSYGLTIAGNCAYVADGSAGLQVINITTPTSPTLAGTYNTPGTAEDVAVFGNRAYVADYDAGLQIIDITNPASPALSTSLDLAGNAYMTAVDRDRVYVAAGTQGLVEVNIVNPSAPFVAGAYVTSNAFAVALAANEAFVATDVTGLALVETGQLVNGVAVGAVTGYGCMSKVLLEGDKVFMPTTSYGFRVVDYADPLFPSPAGYGGELTTGKDIAIAGDQAYVSDVDVFRVFSIATPTAPFQLASLAGLSPCEIALAGDYAYVADLEGYLRVVNITNPASPSLTASRVLVGSCTSVAVAGDYVYTANAEAPGMTAIRVLNPAYPVIVGSFNTLATEYDVAVYGDIAVLAAGNQGVYLVDIQDPSALSTVDYSTFIGTIYDEVAMSGRLAFLGHSAGFDAIDVGNWDITPVFSSTTPCNDLSVCGDLLLGGDPPNAWQIYQRLVSTAAGNGYSTALPVSGGEVVRARLTAVQSDSIAWRVSADGVHSNQMARGRWMKISFPGASLTWHSSHVYSRYLINPTCSQLQIDWLCNSALMDSVRDIPGDQGGQVRVFFTRSGYDFADETTYPISGYELWRRVDDSATRAAVARDATPFAAVAGASVAGDKSAAVPVGLPLVQWHDRLFLQSSSADLPASFPAGTWEVVGTVLPTQQDQYTAVVPSLADSTIDGVFWSVYMVTAHTTTPSVWYASLPDSGYSRDNLAPHVPTTLVVAQHPLGGNDLTWDVCPDRDFEHFNVYRGATAGFEPEPASLVHQTTVTGWVDAAPGSYGLSYKVSAVDHAGNESAFASASSVTGVAEAAPSVFALHQNVPNPFNPATSIGFSVAQKGHVRLVVYDLSGRLVRVLVDDVREAGSHRVLWDGKNNRGERMGSGTYVSRLESGASRESRRMTLLK